MKRGIFLSIILGLCLITCIPQVMAQKQSRMEKLLRYLNDNDADKWQKNREKLDDETQTYYSEELALLDVLHQLWNEHSEQAATNYFGCYGKAFQGNFSTICDEEKIQLSDVRNRAEQSIIYILEGSKDKIPFSRAVIDSIRSTDYPADSVMLQRLRDIRELALLEGMLKHPRPALIRRISQNIQTESSSHKSTLPKTNGSINLWKRSFFRKFQSILRQCRYAEIFQG